MALALGTYLPSAAFTIPRSYVYDVDIALYGDTLSGTGSVRFINATPPDPTFITIEFWNDWYLWTSKSYQIGEVLKNFYYETPPSIVRHDLPFTLGYWLNPATKRSGLYLNWFTGPRLPQIISLPSQPPDYWTPRPLR
jgi:hypothetical protein